MKKQDLTRKLTLTFFNGREKRVISKAPDGKICLLDIRYCQDKHIYVHADELWECQIKTENEKSIIVQPLTRILDAEENYEAQLNKLQNKYSATKKRAD